MVGTLKVRVGGAWGPVGTARGDGALGVIAAAPVFGSTNMTSGVMTAITPVVNVYLYSGRRYRLSCQLRAITSSTTGYNAKVYAGGVEQAWMDQWFFSSGSYASGPAVIVIDGDNTQRALDIRMTGATGTAIYGGTTCQFTVEDIGPNSALAPPVPDTPPAWTALAFGNATWSNMGTNNAPLSYRKIGDMVQVRGEVHFTATGGNPMATLPAGCRPGWLHTFPVINRVNNGTLQCAVYQNGDLYIQGLSGVTDFGLGTIQFSTTA